MPGSADRILFLAEREQEMRVRDTAKRLRNDAAEVWGSIFVSLPLVAAGFICAYLGEPWHGGVLDESGAAAGVVEAFMRMN